MWCRSVHLASQALDPGLIFDDIVDCASATQKLKRAHQCDHSASERVEIFYDQSAILPKGVEQIGNGYFQHGPLSKVKVIPAGPWRALPVYVRCSGYTDGIMTTYGQDLEQPLSG